MPLGCHHHHIRQRIHVNHELFPNPNKLKNTVDRLAYLSIILPLMTLPQLFVIFQSHDARGLSIITWLSYLIGALFWTVYGLLHKAKQISIPNLLMAVIDLGIIFGILLYK